MGNHTPMADLMVGNPETGDQFWVDVKGLSAPNSFPIGSKADHKNLFYILVLVGGDRSKDEFFVLSQAEVKAEIRKYNDAHPNAKPTPSLDGVGYRTARPFKDRWNILPLSPASSN
jgi:hypothetical protein